jgi:hypothetical protein
VLRARTCAYELAQELRASLPSLSRPPGRPGVVREPAPLDDVKAIHGEVLRFVMDHPGSAHRGDERGRYSDAFRLFVVDMRERHAAVVLDDFAHAVGVPLGTLESWLRMPLPVVTPDDVVDEGNAEQHPTQAQIETVLAAWRTWDGDFSVFCEHVRGDLRLDFGRTMIASILSAHGERKPTKRPGRSRDEEALRGAFETFFPGAQWVGDGKQLDVRIDGVNYPQNLELVVDAKTAAAVGISVRAEEDSAAVVEAFERAKETTGEAPLALLLDNRPSNHTPDVDVALGNTTRMRSTPGRAQNKGHVEGSFGLFAQKAPPIDVDTRDTRALARTIAFLVALTFFRAQNHAPRRDRNGITRVELYAETVTPEARVVGALGRELLLGRRPPRRVVQQLLDAADDGIADGPWSADVSPLLRLSASEVPLDGDAREPHLPGDGTDRFPLDEDLVTNDVNEFHLDHPSAGSPRPIRGNSRRRGWVTFRAPGGSLSERRHHTRTSARRRRPHPWRV